MPGYPAPTGRNGPVSPFLNAMLQAQGRALQGNNDLVAARQFSANIDGAGNCVGFTGPLDQVFTIGAAYKTGSSPYYAGVQVGTNLTGFGTAKPGTVTVTTIDITSLTTGPFTVGSTSGLSVGQVIGASENDPTQGLPTPAIKPGTTIAAIGSGTVTLSQDAIVVGSGFYCAATTWTTV